MAPSDLEMPILTFQWFATLLLYFEICSVVHRSRSLREKWARRFANVLSLA